MEETKLKIYNIRFGKLKDGKRYEDEDESINIAAKNFIEAIRKADEIIREKDYGRYEIFSANLFSGIDFVA